MGQVAVGPKSIASDPRSLVAFKGLGLLFENECCASFFPPDVTSSQQKEKPLAVEEPLPLYVRIRDGRPSR